MGEGTGVEFLRQSERCPTRHATVSAGIGTFGTIIKKAGEAAPRSEQGAQGRKHVEKGDLRPSKGPLRKEGNEGGRRRQGRDGL